MAEPDRFGEPEVFIVRTAARTFTWELRRFGGVLLQRGAETFDSAFRARSAGHAALPAFRVAKPANDQASKHQAQRFARLIGWRVMSS